MKSEGGKYLTSACGVLWCSHLRIKTREWLKDFLTYINSMLSNSAQKDRDFEKTTHQKDFKYRRSTVYADYTVGKSSIRVLQHPDNFNIE